MVTHAWTWPASVTLRRKQSCGSIRMLSQCRGATEARREAACPPSIQHACRVLFAASLSLVHDLNGVDAGVIDYRHNRQFDLALGVGNESVEAFFYGALGAARGATYIEIAQ